MANIESPLHGALDSRGGSCGRPSVGWIRPPIGLNRRGPTPSCRAEQLGGRIARGHKALPYTIVAAVLLALLVSACTTSRGGAHTERGLASWYGKKFHGRTTANGETYDMYAMTAAHKTLPFNTMVEVRNRDNGRSTVVRINDRGPFKRGRIIDLSYSAAEDIGLIGPGTARVEIRAVKRGKPLDDRRFTIQVGSFRERGRAQELSSDPAFAHLPTRVEQQGPFYRVLVGDFGKRKKAFDAARRLERQGFTTLVRVL